MLYGVPQGVVAQQEHLKGSFLLVKFRFVLAATPPRRRDRKQCRDGAVQIYAHTFNAGSNYIEDLTD